MSVKLIQKDTEVKPFYLNVRLGLSFDNTEIFVVEV